MQPSVPPRRKPVRKSGHNPDPAPRHLLTVRSALILLLAVLTAAGAAGLQLAAHRSGPLVAFTGFGVLGLAIAFYNQIIE